MFDLVIQDLRWVFDRRPFLDLVNQLEVITIFIVRLRAAFQVGAYHIPQRGQALEAADLLGKFIVQLRQLDASHGLDGHNEFDRLPA